MAISGVLTIVKLLAINYCNNMSLNWIQMGEQSKNEDDTKNVDTEAEYMDEGS